MINPEIKPEDVKEELKSIRDAVVGCAKCELHKTRNLPVVGIGNHLTKIMFVGEAPGAREDATGIPFCGAAGKILDELLESVDIKREDIYICNILKCRPPKNRDPKTLEKEMCIPYLEAQINTIRPEIICTLGNHATDFIFKKFGLEHELKGISQIHGKSYNTEFMGNPIKIVSFYHPAVATYNANMKEPLKKDFEILKKFK